MSKAREYVICIMQQTSGRSVLHMIYALYGSVSMLIVLRMEIQEHISFFISTYTIGTSRAASSPAIMSGNIVICGVMLQL